MNVPDSADKLRRESEKYSDPHDLLHLHALVVVFASFGPDATRRKAINVADAVRSLRINWRKARETNAERSDTVARSALRNAFNYLAEDYGDKHYLDVAHAWIDNLRMIADDDLHEETAGKG